MLAVLQQRLFLGAASLQTLSSVCLLIRLSHRRLFSNTRIQSVPYSGDMPNTDLDSDRERDRDRDRDRDQDRTSSKQKSPSSSSKSAVHSFVRHKILILFSSKRSFTRTM